MVFKWWVFLEQGYSCWGTRDRTERGPGDALAKLGIRCMQFGGKGRQDAGVLEIEARWWKFTKARDGMQNTLECGLYRGIKLLEHVRKILLILLWWEWGRLWRWMTCSSVLSLEREPPMLYSLFASCRKQIWWRTKACRWHSSTWECSWHGIKTSGVVGIEKSWCGRMDSVCHKGHVW